MRQSEHGLEKNFQTQSISEGSEFIRDGMGREEGGGFRMGNTCIPVVDSFRYMAKPIKYCKVKN